MEYHDEAIGKPSPTYPSSTNDENESDGNEGNHETSINIGHHQQPPPTYPSSTTNNLSLIHI